MREEGQLVQWDDAKGYGFIQPDGGGPRLFVHAQAFASRAQRPRAGERLSYEPGLDAQGKRRALKVRGQRAEPAAAPAGRGSGGGSGALWLVPGFAAFYLLCHLRWPLPPALWGGYMAMSLASFIVYAGDKRAARLGQRRVAENSLHLLALACGWPGALLARQLLRHKSSKPAFARRFWLSVAANCLLFVLIFTPLPAWMRQFFG
ncbi:cold shock and DUF1294 domain-containing protein [Roseateles violae]|uniref:Cold shock and DUF1294 domain-containing protein n=1 Tax=Roseateles violae TaxID=3058042 RepID=A0ABT8DP89_9BURK|nr:cold shock and DUF1294 domain-containing protein [Pelomonas sp. PFR6]MDN3920154.1 cold shock and DUF1294 domain-containing protein [Pelomonas sp. PFR6]